MQAYPYVFARAGVAVARLSTTGAFTTNADGAGWYDYDSYVEFLQEMGVVADAVNYVGQLAASVDGVPEIDAAELHAATLAAAAGALPALNSAAIPPPKTRKGRKRDATTDAATLPQAAVVPSAATTLTPHPPVPVQQDSAVLAFMAAQQAAAAAAHNQTPVEPAPAPAPAPLVSVAVIASPAPPTPHSLVSSLGYPLMQRVDGLVLEYGLLSVVDAVTEWTTGKLSATLVQLDTVRKVSASL